MAACPTGFPVMDKLATELTRLYALPGHPVHAEAGSDGSTRYRAATPGGQTRCLRLRFPRLADWPLAGTVFQQLQERWELPAPAFSVSPTAGFELWFSLAQPLAGQEAQRLGEWLLAATLPPEGGGSGVALADGDLLELPPAIDPASRKWSAFIDPTLAGMFAEEAGLDFPPGAERQADMLAGLATVSGELLVRLRAEWDGPAVQASVVLSDTPSPAAPATARRYTDPREFLRDVMNDEAAPLAERIRAAEVLLVNAPERSPHRQP